VRARRTAVAWLVAVLAVALLGLAPASASRLTLTAPARPSYATAARCGSATVTVVPDGPTGAGGTFTSVRVSGVPAGCSRGTVRVASRNGSTWTQVVAAQAAATVSSGTFTVTVPAFHAPGTGTGAAWVMLDGWPVAATWTRPASSPTGPITPGTPTTVISSQDWTYTDGYSLGTCTVVTVTTTSATPVAWSVAVDLAAAPFNGPGNVWLEGANNGRFALTRTGNRATVTGVAGDWAGSATVRAGTSLTFTLCGRDYGNPTPVPGAYTVETSQGTWTPTRACTNFTIRGTGISQFWSGWTVDLPMSSAFALTGGSRTELSPNNVSLTLTPLGAQTYRVTSSAPASVRGTQTFTGSLCAVR